ncbi:NAD-dependent epimerase/dehydratase family protein [Streptomyces sp. NBC_00385]|uniref:NAD-dependent epimerase/dehydratase family protein n=1 Tax=Streptomyces sp. NBC_00385 TaxID=2975733 RepID=UPI002DD8742D|nr:NAD(P)-dependent oxidoreductase [Streptomyces sp. NBC_00385]WRZ04102.1 NAD(P)-dependent oxidoreductase [Streptomyces sp. NBC_00385]
MTGADRRPAHLPDAGRPPDADGLRGSRVVVFGGGGFLGGHVRTAFAEAGARVTAAGRTEGGPDRLGPFLHAVAPAVVVNAAGAVWGADARQMRESNAGFPGRLVAALAALHHPVRLVHLGSVHEYGPVPNGLALAEDLRPAPRGPYGETKLIGSEAVLRAARSGAVDGVVLRISNVSGPGSPPQSLLGTIAARLAQAGRAGQEPVTLRLAPLETHRDFVDARDVAAAVVAAAWRGGLGGEVLNIGRGEAVCVRELVARLIELSGPRTHAVELVDDTEGRANGAGRGRAAWQQVDITRAGRLLAWHPRIPLDRSLSDLLAHHDSRGTTRSMA